MKIKNRYKVNKLFLYILFQTYFIYFNYLI